MTTGWPDGNKAALTARRPEPVLPRRAVVAGLGVLLPGSALARVAPHVPAHVHAAAAAHHAAHPLHAPAIVGRATPPRPLIMLDPGHGGKDPGAIGISGTYEKHVAEAAANELQRQLEASGRYRVAMTRADDRFIPLEGRVDIAHSHKASLFISMHADALTNRAVRGASVYTLSSRASDRQTAMLARTENSADRYGGPHVHADSPEVQEILARRRPHGQQHRYLVSSAHRPVAASFAPCLLRGAQIGRYSLRARGDGLHVKPHG